MDYIRRRVSRSMACVSVIAALACGPAAAATVPVVVTTHPLAALLDELGRGRLVVSTLLPAGASPHTYEPRPSDLVMARRAAALLFVSPTLDGWAARLPARETIEVAALVPRALRLASLETDDSATGGSYDPHFWTDPQLVKAALPGLVAALARIDPPGADAYRANAERFGAALDALDASIARTLAPVAGRAVVLFHPSFQYFLKRYGLRLAGVLEPSPGKEPTPRSLQRMVETVRRLGVKAVFGEPQLPRGPVDALAEAAGVKVFILDPIGGVPGRQSYAELLDYNARVLLEALR